MNLNSDLHTRLDEIDAELEAIRAEITVILGTPAEALAGLVEEVTT